MTRPISRRKHLARKPRGCICEGKYVPFETGEVVPKGADSRDGTWRWDTRGEGCSADHRTEAEKKRGVEPY